MIVVIIIASAIIVSASLYLFLRFLSRRFHRSFRTFSAADNVVSSCNLRCLNDQNGQTNELFDLLPLFTSTVHPTEADVLNKLVSESEARILGNSFRIEIGSVSQRQALSESGWRSYSLGSFDYIVDEGYEVSIGSTHRRGASDCTEKDSAGAPVSQPEPLGEILAAEVAGGQSWLRDYVDRISAISFSSRAMSFRSFGRFFTGSSRKSENAVVAVAEDVEANRVGEEIMELFRWLSGSE
ncbi:hypothetical protein RJ640_011402 [Escallonia rubra]|uniref:Uncharacterized protein n=1 Tax=Escallonia rubra TaxID=112253 RepID=A0AA88UDB3_9ASTE|nr:hypothetical protein RJ640_011402 [Escallonia rubra]